MEKILVKGDVDFTVTIPILIADLLTPIQANQRCTFRAQREDDGVLIWDIEGKTDSEGNGVFSMGSVLEGVEIGELVGQLRVYFSGSNFLTTQEFLVKIVAELPR